MNRTNSPTLYCDPQSVHAKKIFEELGLPFTDSCADADLLWMRKGYRQLQFRLSESQLLNHIPNERVLIDKAHLMRHLKAFDRGRSKQALSLSQIAQETYCLDDPSEREAFFEQLPEAEDESNLWILKPADASRGIGVVVSWRVHAIRDVYRDPAKHGFDPVSERFVIQRYIKNPLLLNDRKSELRIYWLVASLRPLLVLMYEEGTVRLNSLPFKLADFDNTLIHITNVHQQKIHPDYDPSLVLKWTFSDLEKYVVGAGAAGPHFIEAALKPTLKRYLAFVVDATRDDLAAVPATGLHFGLYGADVILDDALHPWLTEVQINPGLSFDDPVKMRVVPEMLREAAMIALEVQARKRRGDALTRLESVRRFEWVVNEA